MKYSIKAAAGWLLPFDKCVRKSVCLLFLAVWIKFILFDLVWCSATTFTPFSTFELYAYSILASLILVIPYVYTRSGWVMWILMLALDMLLVGNLLYFRTYNSSIPLESYTLWGNLSDYKNNVWLSFRWVDALFFAITGAAGCIYYRLQKKCGYGRDAGRQGFAVRSRFLLLPFAVFMLAFAVQSFKGGFIKAYRTLKQSYKYSFVTPMYTVFGSLYYDIAKEKYIYTDRIGERIAQWVETHNARLTASPMDTPQNVIFILLESFESWMIGLEVDGVEITPNLNRLVADSTVFYAPHVLSQVKGGRSADAKLMFNTGLLPIQDGSYSTQFAGNRFPSLVEGFRELYPEAVSCVLCVDKPSTWNQGVFWASFGYDRMVGRAFFKEEDTFGPKNIMGDVPFLRQCAEKIISGENWDRDGNNFVQVVTYSGHYPFTIPDRLAYISLPADMPELLREYMTVGNYTDHAVGLFLEMLDGEGILENTTVIITGDHEGLANHRQNLARSDAGRGRVSAGQYTPLIILNSGARGVYEPVMGQIDIYPTLLDILGLDGYRWRGLGTSIYDPTHTGAACSPQMQLVGDTDATPGEMQDRLREAWEISDLIICHDYFSRIN
ncbi:MAG: LTA synthase family protein [Alistipes sp.]|nr:LTA synthase family protein [Alistipes sp.]